MVSGYWLRVAGCLIQLTSSLLCSPIQMLEQMLLMGTVNIRQAVPVDSTGARASARLPTIALH